MPTDPARPMPAGARWPPVPAPFSGTFPGRPTVLRSQVDTFPRSIPAESSVGAKMRFATQYKNDNRPT